MSRVVTIVDCGPGVTVQDGGRPGWLAYGVSRSGAADARALCEGAALLGQDGAHAALEMAGIGGRFRFEVATRIALTGAPMAAVVDGTRLAWNASHLIPAGAELGLGAAGPGYYGYLHFGGGLVTRLRLGARATHVAAGIGAPLGAGDRLEIGPDRGQEVGRCLPPEDRFGGGEIRILRSFQTDLFAPEALDRFQSTSFRRGARGNRMGVPLEQPGPGFEAASGHSILSDVVVPGDIQITGDGVPFVLLQECQTTGGYPRIGTVIPCDLPRVSQAGAGTSLRFRFIALDEAIALERREAAARAGLRGAVKPLVRDPRTMADLLSYQLIDGMITGRE
ncbi:biotin-dependent carboxyltransferase family protein [Shimia sp.]|uniref:5-oxoprolinase subunit C family protein n=1 Tax=Shimia sp. TaxID=1954381 RepID=UPI0035627895